MRARARRLFDQRLGRRRPRPHQFEGGARRDGALSGERETAPRAPRRAAPPPGPTPAPACRHRDYPRLRQLVDRRLRARRIRSGVAHVELDLAGRALHRR